MCQEISNCTFEGNVNGEKSLKIGGEVEASKTAPNNEMVICEKNVTKKEGQVDLSPLNLS